MTAQEIGQAWLAYVTDTFMLENGCIRPDVEEEYKRLESVDAIKEERELWRGYTDEMIEKILQCSTESRPELLASIDRKSLAFVQDRIQCGTDLLAGLVQKGLKLNVEGTEALPDFYRQILLQNQV
jgi:hypothetical protein